ncbi:TonB-dependent receptor [Aquisediminimonas sediminicola]|uniref:TonB-dependent receptor n=1 Tax=Alteraquisediminimonas sediminicola TaxID=2676787 RepID=UPI001C8D7AD7|nr:TonB-dependent receptor [Aquisediminimonas sediminicola]
MPVRTLRRSLISATACVALMPMAAYAEQKPDTADNDTQTYASDIIVSARQRTERLIDVPVAVTALSKVDLDRYGAKSLSDIAQLAPQVSVAKQASGGGNSFVIRGIGSSTLDTGFDQSVAINVDGVQTGRGRSLQQSYFDLAQVEILKGPQALFFGKNSPAGVISMTSANPTKELSVGGNVGYEFVAREWLGSGYVSGPITETLGARIAFQARRSRGWMHNVPATTLPAWEPATGLDMRAADKWGPKEREIMGRLTLAFNPTDALDMNFKFTTGVSKDNGEGTNGEIVYCGGGPVNGLVDPYSDCKKDRHVAAAYMPREMMKGFIAGGDGDSYSSYKPILASLTTNWSSDALKLTSVTGYFHYNLKYFQNGFEKTSYAYNVGSQAEKYKSFTQEVRALTTLDSPINVMVGMFYQDTSLDNGQSFRIAALPQDPATGSYLSISKTGAVSTKTYSAFGQVIAKLTDKIELAGGIRWTRESKNVDQRNIYVHPLISALFPLKEFSSKFKDNNYSPEATLTYHPTGSTTLYAAYKTGYKSGGLGLPAILSSSTVESDFSFGPEKVKGGEVGAKGEFLNGRLTVNSAIYLYDYKGLQVDIFDGAKVTYQVFNAGSARTKGAEIDVAYRPLTGLMLRAGLGYNKARYRDYLSACYAGQTINDGCNLALVGTAYTRQDLGGAPTVRAPDWSGNMGVSYDTPVSNGMMLGLSTDFTGVSKYYFSETEGPGTLQKGYVKINAGIRLYKEDNSWSIALLAKNLTDKYVVVGGSDRPATGAGTGTGAGTNADILGYIDRPREVTLQLGFKF